ncbi:MAG: RNA-guided pseudouridylation complex pseudouridine synthase subunit Cbf5 [Nanoarchaeota archaeon]|nr:RNA-guided pseudouridylation complex pseudouridine synthase subunit Cbf5 [Nanoarchaeota archaeon]
MVMKQKFNDSISQKFGCEPHKRTLRELLDTGCLVVDKDCGPTSHKVVENVKNILKVEKAGHSGTLDPQVSGVLIIGLNRATRLMEYMLKSPKTYMCLMYIHKPVSDAQLELTLQKFRGKIMQTPPLISAVKRRAREREIYKLEVIETSQENQYVLFEVMCQHGTYIRKLCTDIGESLKVNAQMMELRRLKAGPKDEKSPALISTDELHSLWDVYKEYEKKLKKEKDVAKQNEIQDTLKKIELKLRQHILPMEELLDDLKKVVLRDTAISTITHGSDVGIPGILLVDDEIDMGEEVALMSGRGELVAIGTAFMSGSEILKKDKGAAIKTEKVFMHKGVYPKSWF